MDGLPQRDSRTDTVGAGHVLLPDRTFDDSGVVCRELPDMGIAFDMQDCTSAFGQDHDSGHVPQIIPNSAQDRLCLCEQQAVGFAAAFVLRVVQTTAAVHCDIHAERRTALPFEHQKLLVQIAYTLYFQQPGIIAFP